MKQRIKQFIIAITLILGIGFVTVPSTVGAINVFTSTCSSGAASSTDICASNGDQATGFVQKLVNTLLFIIGILSVIVIIVGAITLVVSGGESAGVTRGKNMITYAVVGLVIAFLAYAIVNWVIGRL